MGRVVQMLPATAEAVNEEAKALIGHLEPVMAMLPPTGVGDYERKIVANIKAAGSCNRTGLILLRALVDSYLPQRGEEEK